MAKRPTGLGNKKRGSPHKTAKRLAAKRQMLIEKMSKNKKHNRKIKSIKIIK